MAAQGPAKPERFRRAVLRRLIRHLKSRRAALNRMQRGTCEFCGRENVGIDAEDVIPLWLSVPILESMNAPRLQKEKGNEVLFRTRQTIEALHTTVRAFCKLKCNNGWMGELETAVSAFLKPMLLSGATTTLNAERQVLLTAWAVKMAMVDEFTQDRAARYFRREERIHLKTWLRPPDDVWVWIGHSQATRQLSTFPFVSARKGALGRIPSVFCYTLLARQLAIQVFAFRRSEWGDGQDFQLKGARFEDRTILLWPGRNQGLILWPPQGAIGEDDVWDFTSRIVSRREPADGAVVNSKLK